MPGGDPQHVPVDDLAQERRPARVAGEPEQPLLVDRPAAVVRPLVRQHRGGEPADREVRGEVVPAGHGATGGATLSVRGAVGTLVDAFGIPDEWLKAAIVPQ